jgi:sugar phosphate permease
MRATFVVAAVAIAAVAFSVSTRDVVGRPAKREAAQDAQVQGAAHSQNFGRAFRLLVLPSIRLMLIGSIVRIALIAIRNSFYVVFLHHLGWNPLDIGIVLSLGSAASAGSAALTGKLHSRFDTDGLLYASLFGMALVFAVVPLSSSILVQAACMVVFGVGNGISQTALISLLAKATPVRDQGLAVGLRTTVNRAVQVAAPLLFGTLVTFVVLPTLILGLGVASLASVLGAAWFLKGTGQASSSDSLP